MAKKKSRHYPVVRKTPLSSGAAASTLVDGARILSSANRRLYRMGRNYSLKVDLRPDWAGGPIEVWALRDDWAVQKAYQMAYQVYLDNTADEREMLNGQQIARWEDFRVSHGLTLAINQARAVLGTPTGAITSLNAGEFDNSVVVDSTSTQRTFTWGTPGAAEWGILQEYDKAGNAQLQPSSVPTDGPYEGAQENIDSQTMDNLQGDGNAPPYDQNGVNAGTPWVRVAVLGSGAAGQQSLSSGFFTAPCGFVLLKGFTEVTEDYSVSIEAKSGDYKGVHAPSMIEVATVNRKRKVVK